ncbi:MBL fold metallo-hydrolase [Alteromonas sp. 1_MG-2023]|uniref:MBL fold metallo-hydrolase n=1 Tax=Alteromonas sp. 1_MG-2023 TaxID=3062669 RepID=UPI0026E45CA3|nr:MBL fold metallo-hydrolase [Alteromonas sp. 1_MG-2023]MDO6566551.1 MBL fold metallo-hydrolase [Alteromonas sp. 1_MG-2023]
MKLHTISGYIQHIYLAEHEHGLLLLDGCSRADVETVSQFITDTLCRPLSDLKLIVVTHMHPDHAGGAVRLKALTGAPIAAHPKAKNWYTGFMGRASHVIDLGLTWWVANRIGKQRESIWYNPVLRADILLEDEQSLPLFNEWKVLYSPGHTDHDISIMHKPTRQAYVADLLVKVKGELVPPYPLCHPNQYRKSLQRIAQSSIETIFCAHVAPVQLVDIPFDHVIENAPTLPKNHWHSAKNRINRKLFGKTAQH